MGQADYKQDAKSDININMKISNSRCVLVRSDKTHQQNVN